MSPEEEAAKAKRDYWFKWAVGICGGVATAAILAVAQFVMFGFDEYIDNRAEDIAKATFANGGVTPSEVEEVKVLVNKAITRMDAADADRQDIKEDLRNVVRILSE